MEGASKRRHKRNLSSPMEGVKALAGRERIGSVDTSSTISSSPSEYRYGAALPENQVIDDSGSSHQPAPSDSPIFRLFRAASGGGGTPNSVPKTTKSAGSSSSKHVRHRSMSAVEDFTHTNNTSSHRNSVRSAVPVDTSESVSASKPHHRRAFSGGTPTSAKKEPFLQRLRKHLHGLWSKDDKKDSFSDDHVGGLGQSGYTLSALPYQDFHGRPTHARRHTHTAQDLQRGMSLAGIYDTAPSSAHTSTEVFSVHSAFSSSGGYSVTNGGNSPLPVAEVLNTHRAPSSGASSDPANNGSFQFVSPFFAGGMGGGGGGMRVDAARKSRRRNSAPAGTGEVDADWSSVARQALAADENDELDENSEADRVAKEEERSRVRMALLMRTSALCSHTRYGTPPT